MHDHSVRIGLLTCVVRQTPTRINNGTALVGNEAPILPIAIRRPARKLLRTAGCRKVSTAGILVPNNFETRVGYRLELLRCARMITKKPGSTANGRFVAKNEILPTIWVVEIRTDRLKTLIHPLHWQQQASVIAVVIGESGTLATSTLSTRTQVRDVAMETQLSALRQGVDDCGQKTPAVGGIVRETQRHINKSLVPSPFVGHERGQRIVCRTLELWNIAGVDGWERGSTD